MGPNVPPWIDEDFLQEVLLKEGSGSVTSFTVEPAVEGGMSYTSLLYRVLVNYTIGESADHHSTSVIVKTLAENGPLKDILVEVGVYTKELQVYNILLPKMSEKINIDFSPKFYLCSIKDTIVLQDLSSAGFVTCDKFRQLDYAHCKYVLMTLAKFHATSVSCCREDPTLAETVGKENVYVQDYQGSKELKLKIEYSIKNLVETLSNLDGQKESCDFLLRRIEGIWENIIDRCKPKDSGFNVLNHGDCWVNNLLFKHDVSGTVIDLKFIDFQNCRYGSPLLDVGFFIWTSANEDVRENRLQELYTTYLNTLNQTLQDLRCEEKYTLEQFEHDLESLTGWILISISYSLPFVLGKPEFTMDMKDTTVVGVSTEERIKKYFKAQEYTTKLPSYFRQLLRSATITKVEEIC